jgi:hypothetical protein
MTFDQFPFARTSIRQYHAIMAISALKPTRIQLPWPDPPTLLPLVVQIIRFVPGSDGASRPNRDIGRAGSRRPLPDPTTDLGTLSVQGQKSGGPGRVEMWRGCGRLSISVSAPFVWRCLTGSALAPFPHPAHRTGRADFPHPALGQDLTPSPTARCTHARSGERDRNARRGARVDKSRPCVA